MEQHEFKPDNSEAQEQKPDAELRLGASALSAANFDARHKEIVDSSFEKARKSGEKLPGQNHERRNYAYLSRLDKLVEKYGNEAEKRLWQQSIKDDLLIDYSNVPETYWNAKKQELRDSGYGNIPLNEEYKHELIKKEREIQKESLEEWANYLGDEHAPYPLWFKIYAWDGMTKMGKYSKGKGRYETRNNTTIAPYPDPDPEVLGGVFEAINRYYGNNEKEFYTEEGERNIKLEEIVKSGNFPKIYNAIEHDIAPIIEPPEKAEDVHGSWIEYGPGDEEDIARAAKGTGWCIASPSVGKSYLGDTDDEWGIDEDDDDYDDYVGTNKARFILFHIQDPATGKLSKNAVASIRLSSEGKVAEISGLKSGQALNDSLVPTVEEKVKTLPGGEKFLDAFADKQMLIRLDHKMQNNEKLTKEELEFIYEIWRPIKTLDTYNRFDPRVKELTSYGVKYAIEAGLETDDVLSKLDKIDIIKNINVLREHNINVDISYIISRMPPEDIAYSLNFLHEQNIQIDINKLLTSMRPDQIALNLNTLLENGADIDINNLVSRMTNEGIAIYCETLLEHGANINLNDIALKLDPSEICYASEVLLANGVNIDLIASRMDAEGVVENLEFLLNNGANPEKLIARIKDCDKWRSKNLIRGHLDTFIKNGANIDLLVANMWPEDIADRLSFLLENGANINNIVSHISYEAGEKLDTLLEYGADIDKIVPVMGSSVGEYARNLLERGADINNIVSNMTEEKIIGKMDYLIEQGADINNIASHLDDEFILYSLRTLIENGADIDLDKLVPKMDADQILYDSDILLSHGIDVDFNSLIPDLNYWALTDNIDTLLEHGVNVNDLLEEMDSEDIRKTLDPLLKHGADIDIILDRMNSEDIDKSLPLLLKNGANIDTIVSNMSSFDIADRLSFLLENGANKDNIMAHMSSDVLARNMDTLSQNGVSAENIIDNMNAMDIVDNLDTLKKQGVNFEDDYAEYYH